MPYAPPESSTQDVAFMVSARYGTTATVVVSATITVADSATEADGDAALQAIVDALAAQSKFSNLVGTKAYTSHETRTMNTS